MTNIMSLMADVHYRCVPFALWRRLALKDYWANRAPEKTCTLQSVIRALIEGITWEQRLLSEAENCCHCQQFSTKSSGHGRLSHRGGRRGCCLSIAHPFMDHLSPSTTPPSNREWPQQLRTGILHLYVLKYKMAPNILLLTLQNISHLNCVFNLTTS